MVVSKAYVLVDRGDPEYPDFAVGGGVELPHQPVAVLVSRVSRVQVPSLTPGAAVHSVRSDSGRVA